jgi:RNA polymerase sigma factor (sigma-70 family)
MTATADTGGSWRSTSLGLLGDERLARHAGAGDAQAFAVVYERYHLALYRYCRSILRNDADAQDALQSTFASAFAALRNGQRDAPMRPWLFRIAHNESISALRRRRPAVDLAAASERGTASAEDEVAGRAEIYLLMRDLRELTDRQRSALVLRELSGLSHEEIAITLGTTIGAAKQMIFEARRALFEFAQGRDMSCDEIRRTISDADGRSLRGRRVRAHLRECTGCAAFAGAIAARTERLHALTPVLPAAATAGLLGRIAVSHVGRGGGSGLARLAAGAAGKGATAGAGFGANALAGVAVVASATVGVTVGVDKFVHTMSPAAAVRAPAPAAVSRAAAGRSSSPSGPAGLAIARPAVPATENGSGAPARPGSAVTLRIHSGHSLAARRRPGLTGAGAAQWPRGTSGPAGPATATGAAETGSVTSREPMAGSFSGGPANRAPASAGADAPGRKGNGNGNGWSSTGSGNSHSAGASTSTGSGHSESSGSTGSAGSAGASASAHHGSWGSGHSGSWGSGLNGSAGSGTSDSTGSAQSASAGSGNPQSAGAGNSHATGSGNPHSSGSGNPYANTNDSDAVSGALGAVTSTVHHASPGVSNAVGALTGAVNASPQASAPASPAPPSTPTAVPPVISLPAPALLHGHH